MKYIVKLSNILAFGLVSIVFLFISHPAYHGGLFQSHDDVQVARIQAMAAELKSGQFPVRYVDEFSNGGGYFLFNFYSPLVYYLGSILYLFGINAIAATKAINLLFLLIGTIGTFTLLKSKTSLVTSTFGVIMFLLSPYVFHDFFHRGALAESSAMMLIPWTLFSFIQIIEKNQKIFLLTGAISFSLIILAHALTAAMVGAVLIILSFTYTNKRHLLSYYSAIAWGVSLAGFYFFPAFLENKYTIYNQVDFVQNGYKDQFINLINHLGSQEIIDEKKPFLGMALVLAITISFICVFIYKKTIQNKKLLILLLLISIGGIFIASPYSRILWEKIEHLRFIQFPYRSLTFIVFSIILAFSLCFDTLSKKIKFLIISICLFSSLPYISYYRVSGYQYVGQYQAEAPCRTTAWNNEHLPVWTKECMPLVMNQEIISTIEPQSEKIADNVKVSNNNRKISFVVNQTGTILIHKHYFPNWKAIANGKSVSIYPSTQYGLITLDINQDIVGQEIIVELKKTAIQIASETISLLAFIFVIIHLIKYKFK